MSSAAFPKYDSYRDSGVEWLGSVPSEWKLTRLGGLFAQRKTKVSDKDYEPLSVTKKGILQQLETAAKTNDGDNRKLVRAGDFVINSRSDRKGSSGVSPLDGSVSLINIVMQPTDILPEFCNHILKSHGFAEEYYRMGHGIVADLWTTRFDEMRLILMALPSPHEQRAIASFLDEKCEKIDEAVRIKEAQIALLRERRQILIQEAVTRGLNPDAPMKDSGIDWIGQIPAHWEFKRLKHLLKERNERSKTGEEPLLMVSQVHGLVVRADFHSKAEVSASNIDNKTVHENDLVFNKLKAHLGVFFKSTIEDVGIVSPDYAVYTPSGEIADSKFFELLFRHPSYIAQFIVRATGIVEGLIRLYTSDLFDVHVAVPPENEQTEIITYADEVSDKHNSAITLKQDQINALKEYKTSLINAAVTGKIKVI